MGNRSKLFLKISFLLVLLVVVTRSISYFRSDNFVKLAEGVFGGSQQKLSWCPELAQIQKIELNYQGQGFVFTQELAKSPTLYPKLCPLAIEAFDARNLSKSVFVPLAVITDLGGATKVIEGDLETGIFRFEGLPFASTQLDWLIKNYR